MRRTTALLLLLTVFAPIASAHPDGASTATFFAGLTHPLTGLDHLLAMIAVGLLAARARTGQWIAPTAFLASLSIGALLGQSPSVLPLAETAIVASVMTLGAVVVAHRRLPALVSILLCSAFGLAHGVAHGAEANGVLGASYMAGMLFATAALQLSGWSLSSAIARRWGAERARWSGLPIVLGGVALLATV